MIQPFDLPERLIGADPDYYLIKKISKTKQGTSFFDPAVLEEYKRCSRNPATTAPRSVSTSIWTRPILRQAAGSNARR